MKLIDLSSLTVIFLASCVLVLTGDRIIPAPQVVTEVVANTLNNNRKLSDIPELNKNIDSFPVFSANAVYAWDENSASPLYEKNADLRVLPASTTKIMTALVSLEEYDLEKIVEVPVFRVEGQKINFAKAEKLTVRDLLDCTLMYSANDAAETLARIHPKGRDGFVQLMNKKAKELSLNNTNFVNPTGLDNYNQFSTPRDLVILSSYAMKNEVFSNIVGTKTKTVKSVDGKYVHEIKNINELLGKVDGVIGVKTGWTEEARENLVSMVYRNGRRVGIALLGSQDRFGETKELIDWIYKSYSWNKVSTPIF